MKFYIETSGGEFVVSAQTEHEAIARYWVHQIKQHLARSGSAPGALVGPGFTFDWSLLNVALEYRIHEGASEQSRLVRSGPAVRGVPVNLQGFITYAIEQCCGDATLDQFVAEAIEC